MLEIGALTDTPYAEYGDPIGIAGSLSATVTLSATQDSYCYLHAPRALKIVGERLLRLAAREFALDGCAARLTHPCSNDAGTMVAASCAVALTGAVACLARQMLTPHKIALLAHRLQSEALGTIPGMQAYLGSALGGIRCSHISPYPRAFSEILTPDPAVITALEQQLLVVCTGRQAAAHSIAQFAVHCCAGDQHARACIWRLRELSERAVEALGQGDILRFGNLLRTQTTLLQHALPVTTTSPVMHQIEALAHRYGALAIAPQLPGGCVTILSAPGQRAALSSALSGAGYAVFEGNIDMTGLRVWAGEEGEVPEDAFVRPYAA